MNINANQSAHLNSKIAGVYTPPSQSVLQQNEPKSNNKVRFSSPGPAVLNRHSDQNSANVTIQLSSEKARFSSPPPQKLQVVSRGLEGPTLSSKVSLSFPPAGLMNHAGAWKTSLPEGSSQIRHSTSSEVHWQAIQQGSMIRASVRQPLEIPQTTQSRLQQVEAPRSAANRTGMLSPQILPRKDEKQANSAINRMFSPQPTLRSHNNNSPPNASIRNPLNPSQPIKFTPNAKAQLQGQSSADGSLGRQDSGSILSEGAIYFLPTDGSTVPGN